MSGSGFFMLCEFVLVPFKEDLHAVNALVESLNLTLVGLHSHRIFKPVVRFATKKILMRGDTPKKTGHQSSERSLTTGFMLL